ncbi:LysR family transcriptional regulator [Eubacteriaceae bacterium ES2]|nr:LysR family transcriptional regulator [Eubacteriaceae bacterium ES2]
MNLRHLKILIAVEEAGSMSMASKHLYISQPSVSQVIRELEAHYGVKLFERLGRKLLITDAGKTLCTQARMVISQFDALENSMEHLCEQQSLKLGATITVGSCLMAPLMDVYLKENPETQSFCYVNNTRSIEERLLRAELDLGLIEGTVHHPDLIVEPVIDDFLVVACDVDHPFSKLKQLTARQLENQPFVMRESGSGTRDLFLNYMKRRGLKVSIGWEVTSPEIIKTILLNQPCLSALSIRLIENELKTGQLLAFAPAEPVFNRTFNLVYHKNKQLTPAMISFMNLVKKDPPADFKNRYELRLIV